jgi:hypothetical protein
MVYKWLMVMVNDTTIVQILTMVYIDDFLVGGGIPTPLKNINRFPISP